MISRASHCQHIDRIGFFVIYWEPILLFLVIIGFSIRGHLLEHIYRE